MQHIVLKPYSVEVMRIYIKFVYALQDYFYTV
jgi:hypothetical protein